MLVRLLLQASCPAPLKGFVGFNYVYDKSIACVLIMLM